MENVCKIKIELVGSSFWINFIQYGSLGEDIIVSLGVGRDGSIRVYSSVPNLEDALPNVLEVERRPRGNAVILCAPTSEASSFDEFNRRLGISGGMERWANLLSNTSNAEGK